MTSFSRLGVTQYNSDMQIPCCELAPCILVGYYKQPVFLVRSQLPAQDYYRLHADAYHEVLIFFARIKYLFAYFRHGTKKKKQATPPKFLHHVWAAAFHNTFVYVA